MSTKFNVLFFTFVYSSSYVSLALFKIQENLVAHSLGDFLTTMPFFLVLVINTPGIDIVLETHVVTLSIFEAKFGAKF